MASSASPVLFSGNSRFATDFRQIIDRSLAIASLPLTQLESQKNRVTDERSALVSLNSKLSALVSSMQALQSTASNLTCSSSDTAVVQAVLTGQAIEGSYTVEVLDTGSQTSTLSLPSLPRISNPTLQNLTSSPTLTLIVDGNEFQISNASGSLWALAMEINTAGAGVRATIVNVGDPGQPDYRLSLRADRLGPVSIQLRDGSSDLLETLSTGTPASFRFAGLGQEPVQSDTRTVILAPGLQVTLLKTGTAQITVTRDNSSLATALSNLASTYNAVLSELDQHRGQNPGALAGSSILSGIASTLRNIFSYETGSGTVRSIEQLGLSFDSEGRLYFDAATFNSATQQDPVAALAFLGSPSTEGFLEQALDQLQGLTGSNESLLSSAMTMLDQELAAFDRRIQAQQERLTLLREQLEKQMAAADALIASLEQQAKYFTNLFQAMMENPYRR